MIKNALIASLVTFAAPTMAVEIKNGAQGNSYYKYWQTGNTVSSFVKINRFDPNLLNKSPYKVGDYTFGNQQGAIYLTEIEFNPEGSFLDDVTRLEDADPQDLDISLSDCKYVALGQWRVGSSAGRFSWCFLKQPIDGENFQGLFWMSLDRPEYEGTWNGFLN